MSDFPFLSLMTFLPALAGIVLLAFKSPIRLARGVSMGVALLELYLALMVWRQLPNDGSLHFIERGRWMPSIGVEYFLGIDGIGLVFLLLTTAVVPMALLAFWNHEHESATCYSLFLLLEAGLIGTFTALNFVHWFFYWELSLIPAFFLVKLAGGQGRGEAATQFFVYTMVGSIAMLIGFVALYQWISNFNFPEIPQKIAALRIQPNTPPMFLGLFVLVLSGLAVKIPILPLHGWLPATYTQAASPVTMVLTGIMSKMGVYGLVRIVLPIFSVEIQALRPWLLGLVVLTIVYSAFAALAQTDLRRILAYSSINHLGYCALGVVVAATASGPDVRGNGPAAALNGVLFQVFSHGILAAGLFACVEFLARRSHGIRDLEAFGGLRQSAPVFAGLMGIAVFASLGLPGLSGFMAEFLIFKGAFALCPWAAAASTLGLLITAIFLLTLIEKIFYGPLNPGLAGFADLGVIEKTVLAPALVVSFLLGFFPSILGGFINPAVRRLLEQLPL